MIINLTNYNKLVNKNLIIIKGSASLYCQIFWIKNQIWYFNQSESDWYSDSSESDNDLSSEDS